RSCGGLGGRRLQRRRGALRRESRRRSLLLGAVGQPLSAETGAGEKMRIATWNVNSLPARLEKVWWWLDRAKPDVLLMQETKLADTAAPHAEFQARGYELAHHGEWRWNGVAIASRC